MPLSAPTPREHQHTRTIRCTGYRRTDGQWDIEGHMTDHKTYPFDIALRGHVPVGEPLHEMWLRLTLDDNMTVRAVEAATDHAPYPAICPAIIPNYQRLVGLTIGPGWTRTTKERLGGVQGCTHLLELLGPLATTAFQTINAGLRREAAARGEVPPQNFGLINSCHAYKSDGEVVRVLTPEHYTGSGEDTQK